MTEAQAFGQRLATLRREMGLRRGRDMGQSEVARALKIPIATYNRLETGTFVRAPEPATLRRLADYFGVTRGWLWFGEGEKHPTPAVVIRDEREDARGVQIAPSRSTSAPRKVAGAPRGRRDRE